MAERRAKPALEKMLEEAKRLQDKERILTETQRLFSKFGEEVVLTILDYVFREHGLATLLKKLGIVPALKRADQQQMLFHYIKRYGAKHFLEVVSHRRKITFQTQAATQQTSPDEQGTHDSQTESPPTAGQPDVERRSGKERRSDKDRRQQAEAAIQPISPDEQGTQDSQAESPPTAGWPAVERRSGKERRNGKDRRQQVVAVFKNRRFGGERRSGVDRRKDWYPTS